MNEPPGCVFCAIAAGTQQCHRVLADETVLAFMDAFPTCDGHVLVIPRHHGRSILEVSDADVAAVAVAVRRVARAIDTVLVPDGLTVTQANGSAAGQSVPHYHVHLLPRTRGQRLGRHADTAGDPERLADLARRLGAEL